MSKVLSYDLNPDLLDKASRDMFHVANAEDNSSTLRRLKKALPEAMSYLTPRQRELVELYYVKGMTMQNIASSTGVNISTVSRTLKRARDTLKKCLRFSMI